jgi:alpha-galactosidase
MPNIAALTGPGSFAMLDNLVVGLPPNVPHAGDPGLTLVEARSHFSLWVMMASPLVLNHDIFHPDPEITAIIGNSEVLAIATDPLGAMATRIDGSMVHGTSPATQIPRLPYAAGTYTYGEQLAKPLVGSGEWAVLLLNRMNTTTQIVLNFLDVGDTSVRCFTVRDLWSHEQLGMHELTFDGGLIPPHGCRMLRLTAYLAGPNCTL